MKSRGTRKTTLEQHVMASSRLKQAIDALRDVHGFMSANITRKEYDSLTRAIEKTFKAQDALSALAEKDLGVGYSIYFPSRASE